MAKKRKAVKKRGGRRKRRPADQVVAELEARIEELKRGIRDARKFSPEGVWEDRDRLELSRADYAELVGVTPLTIYNWEHGRSEPRQTQLEKWLVVRGTGKRAAWRRLGL